MVVTDEPTRMVDRLAKAGLILIPAANNTVRFLPPLNVTSEEIFEAISIVSKTL